MLGYRLKYLNEKRLTELKRRSLVLPRGWIPGRARVSTASITALAFRNKSGTAESILANYQNLN